VSRPGGARRPRSRRVGEVARLFVAVQPPAPVLAHLAEAVGGLHAIAARARATPVERWHVTVAFLGDVPVDRLDDAAGAVAAGAVAAGPADLLVRGGGKFGRGRSSVLWAGVHGVADRDDKAFTEVAWRQRRFLRRARLPYDDRPFRPHLTLAYPGDRLDPELLRADVAALAGYAGPAWTADRVTLFRSYLGPHPRHEPVGGWPLGA
jgi:2'-5' RNA ligase